MSHNAMAARLTKETNSVSDGEIASANLASVVPLGSNERTGSAWIISPVIDLLFCCGGIVWLFFILNISTNFPHGPSALVQTMALFALVGTHALSEPHVAATLHRMYTSGRTETQFKFSACIAPLVLATVGLLGLYLPGVTPILTKVYLLWVVQHFTAQTYGFALLYCYRAGYKITVLEKQTLSALLSSTAVFAMLRQLTYHEWSANGFLAQKLPVWRCLSGSSNLAQSPLL